MTETPAAPSTPTVSRTASYFGSHVQRHELVIGLAAVATITVGSIALTMQGWRSRITTFDLVTYVHSAHDLLDKGVLPKFGDVGTYGSFATPGTAWLLVPGSALFRDPRLAEYIGAGLMHAAALLGLFVLGRKYFSTWCGILAAILYGLSANGIFEAGSLWRLGRPEVLVWTVYCAAEWATRRESKYLAAALAVWGVGMNIDMIIAPIFFIFPVLWVAYRPPIRIKPLLVAGLLVLLVWFPYLRFEAPRHFADLRSQLFLSAIYPTNPKQAWCNPQLVLHNARTPATTLQSAAAASGSTAAPTKSPLAFAKEAVHERLLGNFPETRIPGARWGLMLMVLAALVFLSVAESTVSVGGRFGGGRRDRVLIAAAVLVAGACLVLRSTIASNLVKTPTTLLAATAIAILGVRLLPPAVRALARRVGIRLPSPASVRRRLPVVIGLAVPWWLLIAVAEQGSSERFFWLWPMQVLFLAAFATYVMPRLRVPRVGIWLLQALLVFLVVDNGFLASRLDAWRAQSWSGPEASEVRAVDSVASRVAAHGSHRAAIGYRLFVYPFMPRDNKINPEYKVGADFDLLFRYRRGITNTDTCAEGFSPADEYRIVRTSPEKPSTAAGRYFNVPLQRFRLFQRFGPYEIYRRA